MKWGGGFLKKWTFPQRRVHYVQYQYFLLYILLILGGGSVRTQRKRKGTDNTPSVAANIW